MLFIINILLQGPQKIFGGLHAARRPQFGHVCCIRYKNIFVTFGEHSFLLSHLLLQNVSNIVPFFTNVNTPDFQLAIQEPDKYDKNSQVETGFKDITVAVAAQK
jgi:hypothetical protein